MLWLINFYIFASEINAVKNLKIIIMAHEPKLSVYTIKLRPTSQCTDKSNRFLFQILTNNSAKETDSSLFLNFFQHFLKKLDTKEMVKDEISKKSFSSYHHDNHTLNHKKKIFPDIHNFIFDGVVFGGSFGRERKMTNLNNKSKSKDVKADDVLNEDFYIFLYIPPQSQTSILMIMSYSDESIDSVIQKFFSKLFAAPNFFNNATIKKFFPKSIVENFKSNSEISSYSYITEIPSETLLDQTIQSFTENFKITVKIKPLKKGLTIEQFDECTPKLNGTIFSKLSLGSFKSKKASLKDKGTNTTSQFDLGNDFEIHPNIILSKYINVDEENLIDEIKPYCRKLLLEIKNEIYLTNEITEH